MGYFEQDPEQLEEFLQFLEEDTENVRRVIDRCREEELDVTFKVHEKAETAEQSVENTGVDLDQIVKTLVFIADRPVAVLCPGNRRVDEQKLSSLLETDVRMADPSEVRDATGYRIGGVSPFDLDIPVYIEETILEKEAVKPAAGSRVVGLEIDPERLCEAVNGKKADIAV